MVNKRRISEKGLSLLEILLSVMLLTVVMMSFAMVFPSGYRLTTKNRLEGRAHRYADGLIAKLQTIPFHGNPLYRPTIENLQTWDRGRFRDIFEDTIPEPFYLPAASEDNPGISVQILDPEPASPVPGEAYNTLARVSVTIGWDENVRGRTIPKRVTITTYRSANHE